MSSTCPHNIVNFGLLTAETHPVVWGTPANFNGFRVLAALLHGICSERQPNFAALNRGRHLCSAGRPSRWALTHILVDNHSVVFCSQGIFARNFYTFKLVALALAFAINIMLLFFKV